MPVSINYKLISTCSGGSHYTIDLTPGPTILLHEERVRQLKTMVDNMTTDELVVLSLALHANVNNLTLAQVRDEVVSPAGLTLVL